MRAAFASAKGEDWTRSYLDPCGWDAAARTLTPRTATAGAKIVKEARAVLADLRLTVAPPQPSSRPQRSGEPGPSRSAAAAGSRVSLALARDDKQGGGR